ncbi:cationic amino acid transporter 2-like [Ylistrum balloti]|uniref:cationic amino acid transporter 2-like n=1 Tax=Ylistrum balloti TaxID=509963 RepID=UPI0029059E2A|nr:cationic amino acid transporter 2-like [Ylistrum balloti]
METLGRFCRAIARKKTIDNKTLKDSQLKRGLNIFDLVGIGVGGSLGIGVYVIITHVVKHQTGPSTVLSVLFSGVAALLSAICYAEFAMRLPRAGGSYLYTYAVLGELCAFTVGWTMVLEHIIGAAAAAKAWSQYLNVLMNGTVDRYFEEQLHWSLGPGASDSPDIVACALVIVALGIVILDVKVSAVISCIFTFINGLVILCLMCVGFFHVRHENWTDPPGFFPYGFTGVVSGAGTLFVAFSGVEVVASSTEDTKEPLKVTVSAIFTTMAVCFATYFGVTCALTLAYPWSKLTDEVALPLAFEARNIDGSKYVIGIGGICGLIASTLGCIFAVPRILYAMSNDKVISKCLGHNPVCKNKSGISCFGVVFGGIVSAAFAMCFCLEVLIEMMAIGTLLSFSMVSLCVLCQRYQPTHIGLYQEYDSMDDSRYMQCTEFVYDLPYSSGSYSTDIPPRLKSRSHQNMCDGTESQPLTSGVQRGMTYQKMDSVVKTTSSGSISSLFQVPNDIPLEPTSRTLRTASIALVVYIVSCLVLALFVKLAGCYVTNVSWWALVVILCCAVSLVTTTILITKQPQNQTRLIYRAPYVPFVPLTSLLLNIFMMTSLSYTVWLRFSLWLLVGLLLYFVHGIHSSAESNVDEQEVVLYAIGEQDEN